MKNDAGPALGAQKDARCKSTIPFLYAAADLSYSERILIRALWTCTARRSGNVNKIRNERSAAAASACCCYY